MSGQEEPGNDSHIVEDGEGLRAAPASPWPAIPEDVTVSDDVDLDSDDPALVDGYVLRGRERVPKRQCVATTKHDRRRCESRPVLDKLLCSFHAGNVDPAAGGHALAEKRRNARLQAEERVAMRRLGVRATVGRALSERTEQIEQALGHLVASAANGDIRSAQALLPWIDQALGKPTERVEHGIPASLEQLEGLSSAELAALVDEGRRRRMRLVDRASDTAPPQADTA